MRDHLEETLRLARGGIDDFNEALAWTVQTLDTRFAGAEMVQIHLEQYFIVSDDETDGRHQWNAVVSGLVRRE